MTPYGPPGPLGRDDPLRLIDQEIDMPGGVTAGRQPDLLAGEHLGAQLRHDARRPRRVRR